MYWRIKFRVSFVIVSSHFLEALRKTFYFNPYLVDSPVFGEDMTLIWNDVFLIWDSLILRQPACPILTNHTSNFTIHHGNLVTEQQKIKMFKTLTKKN